MLKAYSLKEKKMVKVVGPIKTMTKKTKTGRTVTIKCGKSPAGDKVCIITGNTKTKTRQKKK